ncbi:pentapeptide repeat-containing protein [Niveispirillum cyanobacteriorum]|uniref:Uncharacterized protein n=1 Tax=Niveispirillum cyanobacteriorum TaxID=1612173 RepID=A0A2K9NK35_9PROT|nr:pentapeptide repeat-containing protein [Niveispirillum cyanobacteriorum]AUN33391.1 hypothetical protein C0V82_23805 [Niveispirillum cyanobacteriorum]GGE49077.1 hypothetical protein GCM10011317_04290 [Niveispirillum cyanobacteriorum]
MNEESKSWKMPDNNPWYILATLHNKHHPANERQDLNRKTWNRYFASYLNEEERHNISKIIPLDETIAYDDNELQEIQNIFQSKLNDNNSELPDVRKTIDFSGLLFINDIQFSGFIFLSCDFGNCLFEGNIDFTKSLFMHEIRFEAAEFRVAPKFQEAIFLQYTYFTDTEFSKGFDFRKSEFKAPVSFKSIKVEENADARFGGARFFREVDFTESKFGGNLFFGKAEFVGPSSFYECEFSKYGANFSGAIFSICADFRKSKFKGDVFFSNVYFPSIVESNPSEHSPPWPIHSDTFSGYIYLDGAEFLGTASFKETKFLGNSRFQNVIFRNKADFHKANFCSSVDFTNSELKGPTDFDGCQFKKSPPQLAGATLHPRTNWRRVIWPQLTGLRTDEVENLTDAYSCLKLEMDKQKRHHDELMFFSKELECRKVELGKIRGFPISLYEWTCDYGQSIILPLLWLFDLTLLGWNVIMSAYMLEITWDKALLASLVNSLGSFGVRKELMESLPKPASTGMQFFLMIQSIIALILLFLIGLGLRNRFRMK